MNNKKQIKISKTKQGEIFLALFKAGDDLATCLKRSKNDIPKAMRVQSQDLIFSALHLMNLANEIEKNKDLIEVEADCHFIGITAPEKIIDDFVKKGLVEIPEYMEEENEKAEDEVLN